MGPTEQPTIPLGDGLVLRPFRDDDAPEVLAAYADPDIRRWNLRSLDTLDDARAWIAATHDGWRADTVATWAVATSVEVVGRVTLYLRWPEEAGEVTYWIVPAARGRGVAACAVRAVTTWAHESGLVRVELRHSTGNASSCRVAEKAGFAAEGILRSARRHDDGWHDMHVHSHIDPEAARACDDEGGDAPCWEGLVEDQRDV